ncbi:hypothetical protein C7443_101289 [Plasticicumulans acidivorans]|uniref:Uncharacterized protein n=2 Tax=Plasticicumulans acidivorans TaxID=886464 RepID=A0A317N0Z5_9GAMM|nr:hypothetical protein C7443_101289 [Plasticicumulans acidivorans]
MNMDTASGNWLSQLRRALIRIICPLLAHDWHFEDLQADGRCTAVCRRCGKREPAVLLVHSDHHAHV